MKLQKNNRYFNIAAYTVISALIVVVGIFILLELSSVWQWIKEVVTFIYVLVEPLLIGFILAYLLDPIVSFYEKKWHCIRSHQKFHLPWHHKEKKKKRWQMRTVPTLFTFLSILCILGLFGLMIQLNMRQVAGHFSFSNIRESIDEYVAYFENMIGGFTRFTDEMGITKGQGMIERIYTTVNALVLDLYEELTSGLLSFGVHALNWLLAIVVAFYLLQDKVQFLTLIRCFLRYVLKEERYEKLHHLGIEVDEIFSGYIRGQIIDATIIVILTSAALLLIRLDFAILIGVIAGIFNLIPYFGPIVGLALAVIIGLLDPNPMKAVYGALAIFAIQQIDGWFIVPNVIGDCVKLHPVVVLLAILIGGNLFGLVGMLLAVPVAAFMRLLLRRMIPDLFEVSEK